MPVNLLTNERDGDCQLLGNIDEVKRSAFGSIDGASSIFFRVCFGCLMAKWSWDYLAMGRVNRFYIEPKFHFTYYFFDWVHPLPGQWMTVHFLLLMLLAVCIATGCLYRFASLLFAAGFTYVFLLDRANYQNHYYLICLVAWWLPWLPLNRSVSFDSWMWPSIKSQSVPRWSVWVLQFHIALPYFFGGLAKLTPDWILGQPLAQMLAANRGLPIIGELFSSPSVALGLAWGGVLFDLAIVPLLLYPKTRGLAYALCIIFHLMNAVIFNIHVFPWFMLAATPIFFSPDWPRRVLGGAPVELPHNIVSTGSARRTWAAAFFVGYVVFHCVWPLRHHLYSGDASWTERGHFFSWRMMLRGKATVIGFAIHDPQTGQTLDGQVNRFLNAEQSERLGRDPEMILQFAHFLSKEFERTEGRPAEVYALVLASLNGRKPQLLIDPNVDLTKQLRGFYDRAWIMPQNEPLRRPAWDLPADQWRQHIELPKLTFLAESKKP